MADLPLGLAQVYVTAHLHSPRGQSRRKLALGTDTSGPRHGEPRLGAAAGGGPRVPELQRDSLFCSRARSQATGCLSGTPCRPGSVLAALHGLSFRPHDVLMRRTACATWGLGHIR